MAQFTTSDGLQLHCEVDGTEGLPLLCLPGLTRTTVDFQYVSPHLQGCRLYKLDCRGRGQSDWDPNWQNYSLPIEVRDIMEWMDHLGLARAAILGTSRGGLQAMGLAAAAPQRVLGVALNDVGPELEPVGLASIISFLSKRPSASTIEAAAAAFPFMLAGFNAVPPERWLQEARTHFRETDTGLNFTYDPALKDAVEQGGPIPDLWPLFDALADKPLCLIRGANSLLLSRATAEKMQARRPDMIWADVPDRGHVPFLDEPAALDALNRWLEQLK